MKLSSLNASYTALLQGKVQYESEIKNYKKIIVDYQQIEHLYESNKSTLQNMEYELQSLRLDNNHLKNRVEILSNVSLPSHLSSSSSATVSSAVISNKPLYRDSSYSNNIQSFPSSHSEEYNQGNNNMTHYSEPKKTNYLYDNSISEYKAEPLIHRTVKPMNPVSNTSTTTSTGPKSLSSLLGNKMSSNDDINTRNMYEQQQSNSNMQTTNKLGGKDENYFKQLNENYSGRRGSLGDVVTNAANAPSMNKNTNTHAANYNSPFATDIIQNELKSFDVMEKQLTSYMYEKTGLADEVDRYLCDSIVISYNL